MIGRGGNFLCFFIIFVSTLSCAIDAHAAEGAYGLSCFEYLELPTRGLLAAKAGESGTVRAHIRIGKDGGITQLKLLGGNPGLQAEVRVAMTLSRLNKICKNSVIDLVFAFSLEDPPTDYITAPAVRFVPPNRFELTFRRVRPNVELPVPDRSSHSDTGVERKKTRQN